MFKTKLIVSLMLSLTLVAMQGSAVLAAPPQEKSGPIIGTVQSITFETDAEGVTTVLVKLDDGMGTTQTVRMSVDTAVSLNLDTIDGSGNPVINEAAIGTSISIDPATITTSDETEGEDQHPVASALEEFFSSTLGIDYETIMSVHEDGVGFGVIAQALWLTKTLDGDTELFNIIIDAKQTHDFSAIILEDGSSPQNWGQFRKALLDHKENLGQIMSGHAETGTEEPATGESMPGNGNGKGQGNGHGGNGQGGGHGQGNGNDHKP